MDVVGKTITAVHRGPWETRPGVDMPGVAGPMWDYCALFLTLDDSTVLQLSPGDVGVQAHLPPRAQTLDFAEDFDTDCIGSTVVDILTFEDKEPTVFVLLNDGRYLDHSYEPGGSSISLGSFSDWSESELEVSFRSLITGDHVDMKALGRKA